MKKTLVILFILFSLILVILRKKPIETQENSPDQAQAVSKVLSEMDQKIVFQSQTKPFGAVQVEIIPIQLQSEKETIFSMSINTHSVDLGFNYLEIAHLTDELGNSYKALSWSGGNGGHHLRGELTFEPLGKSARKVTLGLSGIDGVTETFSWDLAKYQLGGK